LFSLKELGMSFFTKEKSVAFHQTGRNSGVIHSGIYYKPGSYKAKNCVDGRRELVQFAKENNVAHDVCGKIIVATHESELAHMNRVFENGKKNGVEDIELINAQQIKDWLIAKKVDVPIPGCLVFFKDSAGRVFHVGVVRNELQMFPHQIPWRGTIKWHMASR
jgi:L-2-hydroxyglutarate oxidase LhgO